MSMLPLILVAAFVIGLFVLILIGFAWNWLAPFLPRREPHVVLDLSPTAPPTEKIEE